LTELGIPPENLTMSGENTFQLNSEQTLFIGNLARVDYTEGGSNSFSVYRNHHLNIHRTKTENADEFYDKHYNGLLAPPEIDEPYLSQNYDKFESRSKSNHSQ